MIEKNRLIEIMQRLKIAQGFFNPDKGRGITNRLEKNPILDEDYKLSGQTDPGYSQPVINKSKTVQKGDEAKPVIVQSPVYRAVSSMAVSPQIKAMQEEILNFHKDLQAKPAFKTGEPAQFGSFLEFLMKRYINKNPTAGFTFTPGVSPTEKGQLRTGPLGPSKSEQSFLKTFMDSVANLGKHSGTEGAQRAADGIWGPKTQNSIRNISAFAKMLIDVITGLGLTTPLKTPFLDQYSKFSDQDHSKIENKPKAAEQITPEIKQLREEFQRLNKELFEGEALEYSTGKKPLSEIGKGVSKESVKARGELRSFKGEPELAKIRSDLNQAIITGGNIPITLQDLSNLESFKNFLQKNKFTINVNNVPVWAYSSLESIKAALSKIFSSIKSGEFQDYREKQRAAEKQTKKEIGRWFKEPGAK